MRLIQVARSLLVAASPPVLLRLGERGCGVSTPGVPEYSASSASPSSISAAFQVGMLFKFFDQWRSITSNRFVLNMVWGHYLQLRSHPPLFCNFQQININVAAAHHLFRRRVMSFLLRELLNYLLVVLVSILACLWFLSILGASDPYLT